jgi:hypothetical protein
MSALIGIASCVASFLAGVAYANGFAPAASVEPPIAIVTSVDELCAMETGSRAARVEVVRALP